MTKSKPTKLEAAVRWMTALALTLLAIGFVWTVSAEHSAKNVRGSERAHQYAEGTADRIKRTCASSQAPAVYECIAKEIAASREDQRDEYDLSAQQQMADWAFWMMVISSITTVITAWALWYVKGTLDETRAMTREAEKGTAAALVAAEAGQEANRMARSAQFNESIMSGIRDNEARSERRNADERAAAAYELAEKNAKAAAQQVKLSKETRDIQLRAYVGFVEVGVDPVTTPNGERGVAWRVKWKNAGQTPAREVQVWMYCIAFNRHEDAYSHEFETEPLGPEISGVIAPGVTLDGPSATMSLATFRSGHTVIFCRVEYKDMFSKTVRVSQVRQLVTGRFEGDRATFLYTAIGHTIAT